MPHQTNHLVKETSPYLKQHAHNPVNWYPWGNEALDKARKENKPILLSIGYSACHWCHVMAHESFENKETANIMNELFINIKVDREERPDLDKIYQSAHYLLTQQGGGWPLTIFLSPEDLTPFFSGTYFPPEARFHLPAFKDLLHTLSDIYLHQQDDIKQQNANLLRLLQHKELAPVKTELTKEPIEQAIASLQRNYDVTHGGFNSAPKFPQAMRLKFLLRHHSPISTTTLEHMARGGIFDQLGGGFFRYSVDERWEIPHFEKMLYDNGQLLLLYTLADEKNHDSLFANIAQDTAHWVMENMQSSEGGYYSSIDADSENHEGKYYIWDATEVETRLTFDEYAVVRNYFCFNLPPNFENKWHLHVIESLASVAEKLNISLEKANQLLNVAKEKMLAARHQRIAPAKDDKVLTAWNGLMIKGMIAAGDKFKQPKLIDSAQRAIEFIYQTLWKNKRLLASYNAGKTHLPAYLDDYVFLIDALMTALQVNWNTKYLFFAVDLAECLLTYFSDEMTGGFYFTAKDHEKLLYRPKNFMDEAIPAGNGIAVNVLLVLGYLLGEARYLNAAEKTLHAAWPSLIKFPAEHCSLLEGLDDFLEPPQIIVIRGASHDINIWRDLCKQNNNYVFAIPEEEQGLPEALRLKTGKEKTRAYVCKGMQCLNVIENIDQLILSLSNSL